MAYIKVDHSKFEGTAIVIDDYVTLMKNKMASAQGEVVDLSASWEGADYNQFKTMFIRVNDNDSVHTQMVKSLDSYAKYLRFAARKYKDAQIRAVDRANNLPR